MNLPSCPAITAILACTAYSLPAAETQPGLIKTEFIYTAAPFPSCHASTLVESSQGLAAAWFGGTQEKHPDVCIYLSRHEGGAWSPPVEVANGIESPDKRYPTWNPVLFQPKTGPLLLFYKVGPDPQKWWGMRTSSSDAGKTWSAPQRLPDETPGPIKNKPVTLSNGSLLSSSSTENHGWRVHFERSTDQGLTWISTPPVNDGVKISAIQPSILFHPGGKLQAIGRTRQGKLFQIWSGDEGRTWGEMTLTDLPNPSSGTDAVTLKNGTHLLIFNPVAKGRTPLTLAASPDGKTWSEALVLENEPGSEFSYPAIIQTSDGLVHLTYTWKRQRIKHAIIDPTQLKLRPIVDGKWTP
jgi:predicted neuraminidase